MSEGAKKKREIKEKRGEHKNERQPNELAKGEGLEHVQSAKEGAPVTKTLGLESTSLVSSDEITEKDTECVSTPTASKHHSFPPHPKRLRTGGPIQQIQSKVNMIEDEQRLLKDQLKDMSAMIATGFDNIKAAIQALSDKLDAANLPKGEKGDGESEQKEKNGGAGRKGEPSSKGEQCKESAQDAHIQGEPQGGVQENAQSEGEQGGDKERIYAEELKKNDELVEVEVNGEIHLMSREVHLEMQNRGKQGSQRPTLPGVSITESTPKPVETALQRLWREKEESNKLGKGKGKIDEYTSGEIWTEGTELSEEEAVAVMVDYMESTLYNKDEDFSKLIEEARLNSRGDPKKLSTLLRNQISSISVKVNQKKRWAIDVSFKSGHSMFITLQLLQGFSARVLFILQSQIKVKTSFLNEILLMQIQSLFEERLPEVELDPLGVHYSITRKTGSKGFGYLNLHSSTIMQSMSIMKVLNQILKSKINPEKIIAVKAIHSLLAKRDKKLSLKVKELIAEANANRSEKGGSCVYDSTLDKENEDDEDGGAGETGKSKEARTGKSSSGAAESGSKKSQEDKEEEAPSTKKVDGANEEETDILEGAVKNTESAVKKEAVIEDKNEADETVKDAVLEDTVKEQIEDAVMEDEKDTVKEHKEDAVTGKTTKVCWPKRTKRRANVWFSRQSSEKRLRVRKKMIRKRSYSRKATGLGWKKPIKVIQFNSFDLLRKKAQEEITSVEVKPDDKGDAAEYILYLGNEQNKIRVEKDFTMMLKSTELKRFDLDISYNWIRRRIDYFVLEKMVELLQSYGNISKRVMEKILDHQAAREAELFEKFGDWQFHDDSDIAHLLDVSEDEEIVYEEEPSKTAEEATVEEMEAELLEKFRRLNEICSQEPNYKPCVLGEPLRIKEGDEEIYVASLSKLKTNVLVNLCHKVIGSTHFLEQLCYWEIEHILQSRKGEDPNLDLERRRTLYSFPGRRFKTVEGALRFRAYVSGDIVWWKPSDLELCTSRTVKKYIEEIEDDAVYPAEKALVEKLRLLLKEALRREEAARQRRAHSQAK